MHHSKKSSKFFKKMAKRLAPEMRDILLLWFASKKPTHGYQIMKDFEKMSPPELHVKANRIYPGLERMRDKGFLNVFLDPAASAGKPRKLYKLTPEGLSHLVREVDELTETLAAMQKDLEAIKSELTDDKEG